MNGMLLGMNGKPLHCIAPCPPLSQPEEGKMPPYAQMCVGPTIYVRAQIGFAISAWGVSWAPPPPSLPTSLFPFSSSLHWNSFWIYRYHTAKYFAGCTVCLNKCWHNFTFFILYSLRCMPSVWIRVRTQLGMWIWIQESKNNPQKVKKFMFWSARCFLFLVAWSHSRRPKNKSIKFSIKKIRFLFICKFPPYRQQLELAFSLLDGWWESLLTGDQPPVPGGPELEPQGPQLPLHDVPLRVRGGTLLLPQERRSGPATNNYIEGTSGSFMLFYTPPPPGTENGIESSIAYET